MMSSPPPDPQFSIRSLIADFGVSQGGLKMLMTQPIADGCQTDATVDQFGRVTVSQLMKGAPDPCTLCIHLPA